MKYCLVIIGCLFSIACFAADYNVSGYGDRGYYYGDISSSQGSRDVDGYLYDDNGNPTYFSGEWTGRGQIEGYDDNGNFIELEVD